MAAAMEEQSPLLERIGSVLLNGLFGLGLIARDQKSKASGLRQGSTSFGGLGFILATVIEAGQMLAFPFSAVQTVWQGTIIRSAALPVLTVVMPASLDLWFGPAAYQVSLPAGTAQLPPRFGQGEHAAERLTARFAGLVRDTVEAADSQAGASCGAASPRR